MSKKYFVTAEETNLRKIKKEEAIDFQGKIKAIQSESSSSR